MWPKKSLEAGEYGEVFFWAKLIIQFFLCWLVTDYFFPANPVISVPLAIVLRFLILYFVRKLRGR